MVKGDYGFVSSGWASNYLTTSFRERWLAKIEEGLLFAFYLFILLTDLMTLC
jgi:hypothetical protein